MDQVQTDHFRCGSLGTAWQPGLPPGVRQADCDGRANELADADGNRLWNACDARQQQWVSDRFVQVNAERLGDALLDIQDALGLATAWPNESPGALLGRLLWTMWISHRDRALREMVRRGDLSST